MSARKKKVRVPTRKPDPAEHAGPFSRTPEAQRVVARLEREYADMQEQRNRFQYLHMLEAHAAELCRQRDREVATVRFYRGTNASLLGKIDVHAARIRVLTNELRRLKRAPKKALPRRKR